MHYKELCNYSSLIVDRPTRNPTDFPMVVFLAVKPFNLWKSYVKNVYLFKGTTL